MNCGMNEGRSNRQATAPVHQWVRPFRWVLAGVAISTATLFAPIEAPAQSGISPNPKDIRVTARPIPSFRIGDREKTIFGELEWIGGLELIGSSRHFGSLSGISVSDDGKSILAITDNGFWVKGSVEENSDAVPIGLSGVQVAPILDRRGRVINEKGSADAESVDRAIRNGKPVYLVAFERGHRVEAYDRVPGKFPTRPSRIQIPSAVTKLRANKGLESIAIGPPGTANSGTIVLIAERARRSAANIPGWIAYPGKKYRSFQVRRLDDFDITDAAFLPDGNLLLLERRFSYSGGIFMRLRRISAADLRSRKVVDGPVLMTADFTHQIDNMEGLAVHLSPAGETILTIVSDDNRSILQRTLLLRFRLRAPKLETTPKPRPPIRSSLHPSALTVPNALSAPQISTE